MSDLLSQGSLSPLYTLFYRRLACLRQTLARPLFNMASPSCLNRPGIYRASTTKLTLLIPLVDFLATEHCLAAALPFHFRRQYVEPGQR